MKVLINVTTNKKIISNCYFYYICRTHGDGNNNIKPRKRIERMNSKFAGSEDDDVVKSLKPPKISGIGEYFDVHVTMAAHPGNFTVQPFDDKRSLEVNVIFYLFC